MARMCEAASDEVQPLFVLLRTWHSSHSQLVKGLCLLPHPSSCFDFHLSTFSPSNSACVEAKIYIYIRPSFAPSVKIAELRRHQTTLALPTTHSIWKLQHHSLSSFDETPLGQDQAVVGDAATPATDTSNNLPRNSSRRLRD